LTALFSSFSKDSRLDDLGEATQHCTLCPRMCHRSKILSHANGNPETKVIFIAEAPGRLGADRTGIPLHGDKTGDNFERLLGTIGWDRDDVFITNAVLCNPREENGNNGTPNRWEIKQCSVYLEMTLNLINPEVIVTLGRVALEALAHIHPHELSLSNSVGKLSNWNGYHVFPVYHPAPRALIHRSFPKQTADYILLAKTVEPLKGVRQKPHKTRSIARQSTATNEALRYLISAITSSIGRLSYFKLNKLLYLIDLTSLKQLGSSITGELYLRQQEGPWLPRIREVLTQMDRFEIDLIFQNGKPYLLQGQKPRMAPEIAPAQTEILKSVLSKYENYTDSKLKTAVYLTEPMRFILRQERKGRKMVNKSVLYKDKTIIELDKEDIEK